MSNKQVTVSNKPATDSPHESRGRVTLSVFNDELSAMDRLAAGKETLSSLLWTDISKDEDASVLTCSGELGGLPVVLTALATDELSPGSIREKDNRAETILLRDAATKHAGGQPQTFTMHVAIGDCIIPRQYILLVSPQKVVRDVPVEGETGPAK